jgi:hypothetical protein
MRIRPHRVRRVVTHGQQSKEPRYIGNRLTGSIHKLHSRLSSLSVNDLLHAHADNVRDPPRYGRAVRPQGVQIRRSPFLPSDWQGVRTLPTPCARDGKGPGHQYGLPDLVEPGGSRHDLLPTPTAEAHGSNRSPSPGATRRPGPHQPAGQPLPTVADSRSAANATAGRSIPLVGHAGRTLTDAARLLPTPRASDTGTPGRRAGTGFRPPLSQVLLPTPRASDGAKGCPGQRGSHGDLTLPSAAVQVPTRTLPTPRASDGRGPGGHGDGGADLRTTIASLPAGLGQLDEARWGVYAAAVARWELLLGRPAPEPTQTGRHGKPVLSPTFVEWLMGLDPGWITSLGLPRTAALRVLGNGVVPQQAAVALRLLLCPHRWAALR